MPKKNLDDPWEGLRDIFREVSWPIKLGLGLGLLLGVLAGGYFASFRLSLRFISCSLIGSTLLGGFLGLAGGVGLDFLLARIFPKDDDPPGGKKRG